METSYKFGEVRNLNSQIEIGEPNVQFKSVFGTDFGSVSLLAFEAGQKLEQHTAPFEVMVVVLEGEIEFTMLDTPHLMKEHDFLLMGADVKHSVEAKSNSKVLLVKIKD